MTKTLEDEQGVKNNNYDDRLIPSLTTESTISPSGRECKVKQKIGSDDLLCLLLLLLAAITRSWRGDDDDDDDDGAGIDWELYTNIIFRMAKCSPYSWHIQT